MIENEKGKWLKKGKIRALKEPSEQYKKEKEQEILINKEKEKRTNIKKEINKIDGQLIKAIPDMIVEFLPLLETLGFTITDEQKALLNKREELKQKL